MEISKNNWNIYKDELINNLKQLVKNKNELNNIYEIMIHMLESPETHLKVRTKRKED